jgi:hypothetical protein
MLLFPTFTEKIEMPAHVSHFYCHLPTICCDWTGHLVDINGYEHQCMLNDTQRVVY